MNGNKRMDQTQFTDTHVYFTSLISPSTEAKVTTSPTCFPQPFIHLDREASRRSCDFRFCRWGDQGGEVQSRVCQ